MSEASDASDAPIDVLVREMHDPTLLLTTAGKILRTNRAFAKLAGARARELAAWIERGVTLGEILAVADPVAHDNLRDQLRHCGQTGRSMQIADLAVARPDGSEIILWVSCVPIGVTGDDNQLFVLFREVTGEVRMQLRLRDLLEVEKKRAEQLERAVEARTGELKQALVEVMRLAHTDPLTDLLNRRAFTERVERALKSAERHQRRHALCVLDLDHFKAVNDTYGHEAGDKLLVATARALEATLRQTDIVARIGGEEFAVLLEEVGATDALEVADRVRLAIAKINVGAIMPGRVAPQTASIGVAQFQKHGDSLDALLRAADAALYRAKGEGRNRVIAATAEVAPPTTTATTHSRRQALLAFAPRARAALAALTAYSVHMVDTVDEATAAVNATTFDVVLAEATRESLALLEASCWRSPNALRLLTIASPEQLLGLEGLQMSMVDGFVLAQEVERDLQATLERASARRQVMRDTLMRSIPGRLAGGEVSRGVDDAISQIVGPQSTFAVALQPIMRLHGDRGRAAAELLLRPPGGLNPAEVCSRAHERGLLGELGRRVRLRAAALLAADPELTLFVNVDAAELFDAASFEGEHDILAHAHRVVLEITERSSLAQLGQIRQRLARLRELGFRIAVDDLGSGYASLSALATFEPNFVKLDREIVAGVGASLIRRRLVELVVQFAREHGIVVIAEGIETQSELDMVTGLGCQLGQGYHLGRPVTVASGEPGSR